MGCEKSRGGECELDRSRTMEQMKIRIEEGTRNKGRIR